METYRKSSWTALLLSRVHPRRLILYDYDYIEAANMSGQFYSNQDIGQSKVAAIANLIGDFSEYYNVITVRNKYTEYSSPNKIMICGFDNMQARRTFYNSWKTYISRLSDVEREDCLFIDGRLAAEELQVLCLTGTDTFNMKKYEQEWLFSDEEADATICSYKQTTYMANMIGSIIVNLFTNFCANQTDPVIPRDLPFLTSYDASLMYFKTEV